jgi:hypothetical protein
MFNQFIINELNLTLLSIKVKFKRWKIEGEM